MIKKSIVAKIIAVLLRIMLGIGVVSLPFIPKLYDLLSDYVFGNQSIFYKIGFYICIVISLLIIYGLIRIIDNVYKGSSFKNEMEITLKIIAILFMLLTIIVAIKVIFIPTLLSIAVAVITFMVSLCFYVLSQVFKTAIEYKNEIDYTV